MIKLDNVSKQFGDHVLFKDVSFEIGDGEFVVFSGASGCGKTTMLNIIGGLEPPSSGSITVDGVDISKKKGLVEYYRSKVGFLFQNFALVENKTVRENLEFVRKDTRSDITIEKALERVGIPDKADAMVYTLSGGEQQRVALARLMVKKCDIILADEPTGSLDKANALEVMEILKSLNEQQRKTVIMVTHDEELKNYGSRVVSLPIEKEQPAPEN